MNTKFAPMLLALLASVINGCATSSVNHAELDSLPNKTLVGHGYATFDDSGALKVNQRWLSAQQVSKLNAYRGLADQLYYEPVGENKTVGSQVVSHEAYRVYLDGYLREAKASDYRTVQNSLKTTLTLNLTPRFYRCMGGDPAQVNQCLREDGKLPITRLGTKPAVTTTANLACGNRDCSDQFYVQGFANDRNLVDDVLLNAGLYDVEWTVNNGARAFFNSLLFDGFINAL